jgi:hypothetical protein
LVADTHLAKAQTLIANPGNPAFQRLAVDVAIQSGIGRFMAQKLRAGVAYTIYERLDDRMALEQAVNDYRAARDAWKKIVSTAKDIYQDDLTYGREPYLRGHWADRLPAIEKDLAEMEKLWKEKLTTAAAEAEGTGRSSGVALLASALAAAATPVPRPRCEHLPPPSIRPGEPVVIELAIEAGNNIQQARLHYRHVNQGEDVRIMDLAVQGNRYRHTIPGDYTDAPYPLMYYFELHDSQGQAWLHPGLTADLSSQPYFVIRKTS